MSTPLNVSADVRARLFARRDELLKRLERVAADQRREREPLSTDSSDRAIQLENDEVVDSIGNSVDSELRAVNDALSRLDAGRYGLCKSCGKKIDAERLAAIPYAQECRMCVTHS